MVAIPVIFQSQYPWVSGGIGAADIMVATTGLAGIVKQLFFPPMTATWRRLLRSISRYYQLGRNQLADVEPIFSA
jgi:hypothetical protein